MIVTQILEKVENVNPECVIKHWGFCFSRCGHQFANLTDGELIDMRTCKNRANGQANQGLSGFLKPAPRVHCGDDSDGEEVLDGSTPKSKHVPTLYGSKAHGYF